MQNALEIHNFSKKYGDFVAVDNISLTIKKGEFYGFLGQNGAGKSTTIHAITGINRYSEGSIKVFGIDAKNEYKMARTKIGLCPQEFNVDIFAPTTKILWYIGGYYGMTKEQRKKRIEELLEIFELKAHADKPFRALSGGLKRRVMLARAMMHDPELLILDEPTAGVDVELRNELHDYLRKINAEGKTILLTSHYLEEIEKLCTKIAIIHKGKIIANADKSEFLREGKSLEKAYLELTSLQNKKNNV